MNEDLESFVNSIRGRNNVPWSAFAHGHKELEESHTMQPSSSAATSLRSSSAATLSSLNSSIVTKPTSYGTAYPIYSSQTDGKVDALYAASLSATHGSRSEADEDNDDLLHTTLFGIGGWSSSHPEQGQCLRERENARPRQSKTPPIPKKHPVVLHQYKRGADPLPQATTPLLATTRISDVRGPEYHLHHVPRQYYIVCSMICLTVSTVSLSGLTVYYTDKTDAVARRRTIFVATTILSLQTVVMMLMVRRSILEATILGLSPLIFGFLFMLHLNSPD